MSVQAIAISFVGDGLDGRVIVTGLSGVVLWGRLIRLDGIGGLVKHRDMAGDVAAQGSNSRTGWTVQGPNFILDASGSGSPNTAGVTYYAEAVTQ